MIMVLISQVPHSDCLTDPTNAALQQSTDLTKAIRKLSRSQNAIQKLAYWYHKCHTEIVSLISKTLYTNCRTDLTNATLQ